MDSDSEVEEALDFPSLGDSGSKYTSENVDKNKKKKKSGGSFQSLGLRRELLSGIRKLGYNIPTPIQRKSLPISLSGRDVVAMARTGSGKTAAFLIPLIEKLESHSHVVGARGLVLSPTRELAQQTNRFALALAKYMSLRVCLLQGGDKMEAQFQALSNNPDVIIATPGRLVHLLVEVPDFGLKRVEVIVIDEADRLFEMGFALQLQDILTRLPEQRQTLLFSATMPTQLLEFARAGLDDPELIRLDSETRISENLNLAFFMVRTHEKAAALIHLLTEVIPYEEMTIVFAATKHHVEYIRELLSSLAQIRCSIAYGTMDMSNRTENLENFRRGITRILVVTDVAARGLDIPLLNNVINYDFPAQPKLFVHRVGRAARQNRKGTAYSFATIDEVPYMIDLHLYLGRPVQGFIPDGEEKSISPKPYNLQTITPDDVHVGKFPQELLDPEMERLTKTLELSSDLQSLDKSMKNAQSLYVRTRQEASKRSVKRARELGIQTIVHPIFQGRGTAADETRQTLENHLKAIRNFRPSLTVFEVETMKRGKTLGKSGIVMRERRKTHQHVVVKTKAERARKAREEQEAEVEETEEESRLTLTKLASPSEVEENTPKRRMSKAERKRLRKHGKRVGSLPQGVVPKEKSEKTDYKDPTYFIEPLPQNYDHQATTHLSIRQKQSQHISRLEEALLDVNPDESKQIIQKERSYRWDKKKKKYIKASMVEHLEKNRVKNESGTYIKVNEKDRGKIYDKWQKKTRKRLLASGEAEQNEDSDDYNSNKRHRKHSEKNSTNVKMHAVESKSAVVVNRNVQDELKTKEAIKHDQKVRQKKMERNARTPRKYRTGNSQNKRKRPEKLMKRGRGEVSTDKYARSRAIVKRSGDSKKRRR